MTEHSGPIRTRRVAATGSAGDYAGDYADAVEVSTAGGDPRSPEQWARAVFEGAPAPVRWFLLLGWRFGLGLRLGPRPSPGHVLGWRIVSAEPGTVLLQLRSPLMSARLLLRTTDSSVVLATDVSYLRAAARPLWVAVAPVHRQLIPYLLRHAARARPADREPRMRRPLVIRFQRRIANPVSHRLARFLPGHAVIETTGRHSGLARSTPVGGRLLGSTFWLVSEFGRRSNYVRNLDADPRVRIQLRGRWHCATATILDDDEPRERLKQLPRVNSLVVRLVGTDLLTVRLDLDEPANEI